MIFLVSLGCGAAKEVHCQHSKKVRLQSLARNNTWAVCDGMENVILGLSEPHATLGGEIRHGGWGTHGAIQAEQDIYAHMSWGEKE